MSFCRNTTRMVLQMDREFNGLERTCWIMGIWKIVEPSLRICHRCCRYDIVKWQIYSAYVVVARKLISVDNSESNRVTRFVAENLEN